MSNLRVLIVGASIAGPMAAHWFAKAGAKVTVIERFPSLRTNGQAIDIRTYGVTVMNKIPAMEAKVRAKQAPIDGMSFVRSDGRPFGVLTQTGDPDQQSLISEYEIYRGDLSRILVGLTKDNENVKYVFNEQIEAMKQNEKEDGPVKVDFMNGYPSAEYDLVVACDGATSRTRAMAFNSSVREHTETTNSWAAYFSVDKDITHSGRIGQAFGATGGRFTAVGSHPDGGSKVVLMSVKRGGPDNVTAFRAAQKKGDDALKTFVAEQYKGIGWKLDEILEGMKDSKDFYASEMVLVKTPSFSKGRVVLVGDAGYGASFTGSGTALAITGAYLLAGEISKNKGDLAAGLRGYEEKMRPITNDMAKIPPFIMSIVAPQTEFGLWLRNHIFAFLAWSNLLNFAQKYLGAAFADRKKYILPEYEWEL